MTFHARYSGECPFEDCHTGIIEPGDEVLYVDGVLMHHSCENRQRRQALPTLCEDCWTHHKGPCL